VGIADAKAGDVGDEIAALCHGVKQTENPLPSQAGEPAFHRLSQADVKG
jgi:hypothetical protein